MEYYGIYEWPSVAIEQSLIMNKDERSWPFPNFVSEGFALQWLVDKQLGICRDKRLPADFANNSKMKRFDTVRMIHEICDPSRSSLI